jgi:uncharacterized DUF497 family protein
VRFIAVGKLGERLIAVAFTPRQNATRVVSMRPAGRRERSRYDET